MSANVRRRRRQEYMDGLKGESDGSTPAPQVPHKKAPPRSQSAVIRRDRRQQYVREATARGRPVYQPPTGGPNQEEPPTQPTSRQSTMSAVARKERREHYTDQMRNDQPEPPLDGPQPNGHSEPEPPRRTGGRTPSAMARSDRRQRYTQEMKRNDPKPRLAVVEERKPVRKVSRDVDEDEEVGMVSFVARSEKSAVAGKKKIADQLNADYRRHLEDQQAKKDEARLDRQKKKRKGNKFLIKSDYQHYQEHVTKYKMGEADGASQGTPTPRQDDSGGTLPFVEQSEKADQESRRKIHEKMKRAMEDARKDQENKEMEKRKAKTGNPLLVNGQYDAYKEEIRSPLQESDQTNSMTK